MRPCVGIQNVCPPMCTKAEIDNGTYSLADIEEMNQTMEEELEAHRVSIEQARNQKAPRQ